MPFPLDSSFSAIVFDSKKKKRSVSEVKGENLLVANFLLLPLVLPNFIRLSPVYHRAVHFDSIILGFTRS